MCKLLKSNLDANSAMEIERILAHWKSPGGNLKEILPLPNSERRGKIELWYAECDWKCACAAAGYNSWRCYDMSKLTIKEVFTVRREKFCSINGAPIGRLVDENLRKERAMLAQAETKTKVPFANRNGKPDKSDGFRSAVC